MKRRRNQHPPLVVGDDQYECGNKAVWPPAEIAAYWDDLIAPLPAGVPVAEAFRGVLSDLTYQRIKTWEQVCGLREMCAQKCPTCPASVKNGVSASVPGTGLTHTIHTPHPGKKQR